MEEFVFPGWEKEREKDSDLGEIPFVVFFL